MARFQKPALNDLNHHIWLQTRGNTKDGMGGYSDGWVDSVDAWARAEFYKGVEQKINDQTATVQYWYFTIRYYPSFTPNAAMRVRAYDGTVYNVKSVSDPDKQRQWLWIEAWAEKQ